MQVGMAVKSREENMMEETPSQGQENASTHSVPTLIEFLLDETGSMSEHADATIGGYNDFLDQQKQSGNGLCLLTLTKFDSLGLRTPYVDIDVHMVPYLTKATFLPGHSTNLRDAIISRIDNLTQRLSQWDIMPRVLFVVMTDGEDNVSHARPEHAIERIRMVTNLGWTCVYLGANQNANQIGETLGFLSGNIRSFETAKMRETMQELGRATVAFRAAEVNSDFFTTQAAV